MSDGWPEVHTELHEMVTMSPKLVDSTRNKYLRDLHGWCAFAGTDPYLWTPRKAQEWYNSMLQRGLKPQSASRALASLKYASQRRAALADNTALDFARNVETASARDEKEKKWFSPEDAISMLATCRDGTPAGLRDYAMFVVMLETGMRRMSLCSMQIETTTLLPGLRGTEPQTLVVLKGQQHKLFSVPLSDTACHAIAVWMTWLAEAGIKSGPLFRRVTKSVSMKGDVIHYHAGLSGLTKHSISYLVTDRGSAAGFPDAHPHMFRHTFSTWRTEAGYAPHELAAMTGHKLKDLGALGGYIRLESPEIRERIRTSTPQFLKEFVARG